LHATVSIVYQSSDM